MTGTTLYSSYGHQKASDLSDPLSADSRSYMNVVNKSPPGSERLVEPEFRRAERTKHEHACVSQVLGDTNRTTAATLGVLDVAKGLVKAAQLSKGDIVATVFGGFQIAQVEAEGRAFKACMTKRTPSP